MGKGLFGRLEGELGAREKSPGLQMSDLLSLPEPEGNLLNWMLRQGAVTFAEVNVFLGQDETRAREILTVLYDKGYVRLVELHGVSQYQVRLAPKRGRTMPANLWRALDNKVESGEKQEK